MDLLHLDPDQLHPNPWNTNRVAPQNMDKLTESLRRHGWVRPVLVREFEGSYQILGGQHRVEAAKSIGLVPVPVVNLGEIDEKRAKEIGLLDNARYGEDDALGLAELLADLGDQNELRKFLPFLDNELAAIDAKDINLDTLDLPEEPEQRPKTRNERTHQVLRFKVPVEDADFITDTIRQVQNEQGFAGIDSLANAGDALVWIFANLRQEGSVGDE